MSQFENPAIRLKKLTVGVYEYTLIIEGKNEETRLSFDVLAFPTTGTYHLKFKDARGIDKSDVSHFLKFTEMVFDTNTMVENSNSVSISLTDISSGITFDLENILFVTKEEIDNSPTAEDYKNNESFQNMVKQQHKMDNRKNKQSGGFSLSKWISSKIK